METRSVEIPDLLAQTYHDDPRVRWRALIQLCPCHVKRNRRQVWDRVISLTGDVDAKVRHAALHVLTDGSPRVREPENARILERLRDDPDPRQRRKAREILAQYRRTGTINVA